MFYRPKNPMNRWATADEIAGPTVFLLFDAASYITGTILCVDGGWLAADGRFTPPGMSGSPLEDCTRARDGATGAPSNSHDRSRLIILGLSGRRN